jgi:methyl-accepting chemotaxis protein
MKTFIQRRYLLWDTVQPRFLAVSVAHQSLVFLVFAGSIFVPLIMKLHNTPLSSPEAGNIGYQFTVLHDSIWPAFPVALVLILVHSVFFSHRIAGPLYRFRNVFKAISQGNLMVETKIRSHDYLKKEADGLETMVGELRSRLTVITADCHALATLVGELKVALRTNTASGTTDMTTQLEQHVTRLMANVQQFKVQDRLSNQPTEVQDDAKAA